MSVTTLAAPADDLLVTGFDSGQRIVVREGERVEVVEPLAGTAAALDAGGAVRALIAEPLFAAALLSDGRLQCLGSRSCYPLTARYSPADLDAIGVPLAVAPGELLGTAGVAASLDPLSAGPTSLPTAPFFGGALVAVAPGALAAYAIYDAAADRTHIVRPFYAECH